MNILGIDLGSTQISAAFLNINENDIKIIGFGKTKSQGIKKGTITNIELASRSIKEAVNAAKISSDLYYDKVVVSLSGAYAKSVESVGVTTIKDFEIGIKEIQRAVNMAKQNAEIPTGYQIIHILPTYFKVNDQFVDDPFGMSGNRLEVSTHIVISQEIHVKNIKKTVESAGLKIDNLNLVLSGYASSIACLEDSEKELGVALIDIGEICDIVVHMGNSICYNEWWQVGSKHITSDLSVALNTSLNIAEQVKLDYEQISQREDNVIKVSKRGSEKVRKDEKDFNEIPFENVSQVIFLRTEEILNKLNNILDNNPNIRDVGAGVVLTGGMVKLFGLMDLANSVFKDKSIRITHTRVDLVSGFDEVIDDPENSCVIGLCLYGAGYFTQYEIDSNERLRHKEEIKNFSKNNFTDDNDKINPQENYNKIEDDLDIRIDDEKKQNWFIRFFSKIF